MGQPQPAEKERKKYLKLDERAWVQVRTFVDDYFGDQEKAEKATYKILFKEIEKNHPGIDLRRQTFQKHVASIEELKRQAGIPVQTKDLTKDDRSKLTDIFLAELIGLNLEEFESIRFDQLIQRAHTGNVGLDLTGKNKNTLAHHFKLHKLKALARAQRPANEATAPVGRTVQDQEPPDPQAPGAAAAIDGQRRVTVVRQGQAGPGFKRPRPEDEFEYPPASSDGQDDSDRPPSQRPSSTAPRVHDSVPLSEDHAALRLLGPLPEESILELRRDVAEHSGDFEAEDHGPQPALAPPLAYPAQPEAGCSGYDALETICEYSMEEAIESSRAQEPGNRRSEPGAELRPEGMCTILACLVLVLKHLKFTIFGRSRRSCCGR